MRYQLLGVTCLSVSLSACSAIEGEQPAASTESLQTLRDSSLAPASPAVRASILRAGLRLCDLQADRRADNAGNGLVDDDPDDGGWDWQIDPTTGAHSNEVSAENLFGAAGLGLWAALQVGKPRLRLLTSLVDAYAGIEQNQHIASAPDFVLLSLLSDRYSDERYAQLARQRYDARIAAVGDAAQLATQIRDARHAGGADGLIAYDLGWFALGALALGERYPGAGYFVDYHHYVRAVLDDLVSNTPDFDPRDPHEAYYVTGLAWSMLVSSWDPFSRAVFNDLRSRLLSQQLSSGAWPYNADYTDANLQATAHALIALGLTRRGDAMPHVNVALAWLTSGQNDNGGWSYAPDQEYPLLDAEVNLGMYLVRSAAPELVPNKVRKLAFALSVADPESVPKPAAPIGGH